jgi:uncharacterized protein (DUF924 family)
MMETTDTVIDFWFGDGAEAGAIAAAKSTLWWGKSADNDRAIEQRFAPWVERAAARQLDDWLDTPRGRLALIILIDQFSRNIHRDSARAFAGDALARGWALEGLAQGVDRRLRPIERVFFFLPLEHSEDRGDQAESVRLYQQLVDEAPPAERQLFAGFLDFAVRHRDIIERFGRFPHRNAILGRDSTPEEQQFLREPGSSF